MAVLTAVASLSMLVPLYRGRRTERLAADGKQAIYRDQLDEIERDLARSLIAESEAAAARTEIARRLLRASDAASDTDANSSDVSRKFVAGIAAIVVPLLALGFYLSLGSPQFSDRPLGERISAPNEESEAGDLIARVEAHLGANPDDGRGWELLGPVYSRLGRYDDAASAFANALRILGPSAQLEADMGEAIMLSSGNVVTVEARAAFERASELDKDAVRPRFYLAVAHEQEGRNDEAITAWRELLALAPANASWVAVARRALARLEEGAPDVPGPSAGDVEAVETLTPGERAGMIGAMVDQLAARLASDPDDAEGWARLIRSYMVLGKANEAESALATARQAFVADGDKMAIVETEARTLGLIE